MNTTEQTEVQLVKKIDQIKAKINGLAHILHLEILMSKPQLSVRGINRSISSKRRDTTI